MSGREVEIDPIQRVAASLAMLLDLSGDEITDASPGGLLAFFRPLVVQATRDLLSIEIATRLRDTVECARRERIAIESLHACLESMVRVRTEAERG